MINKWKKHLAVLMLFILLMQSTVPVYAGSFKGNGPESKPGYAKYEQLNKAEKSNVIVKFKSKAETKPSFMGFKMHKLRSSEEVVAEALGRQGMEARRYGAMRSEKAKSKSKSYKFKEVGKDYGVVEIESEEINTVISLT